MGAEKESRSEFVEMPDGFQVIAAVIFECAAEDVPEIDRVRELLADIHDIRYAKIRHGLTSAKDAQAIKMNNLSTMEITSIRPFFIESMNAFYKLNEAVDTAYG